jgi:hypothetical protein
MADHFAETSQQRVGLFATALLVVGALAIVYGIGIGICSLREPDTCFLLAMGRWICEHHSLPKGDPFSYTFALFPQDHGLVIYQWLTEVIFYSIAKLSGVLGLVIFSCGMLTLSLVILPLRLLRG